MARRPPNLDQVQQFAIPSLFSFHALIFLPMKLSGPPPGEEETLVPISAFKPPKLQEKPWDSFREAFDVSTITLPLSVAFGWPLLRSVVRFSPGTKKNGFKLVVPSGPALARAAGAGVAVAGLIAADVAAWYWRKERYGLDYIKIKKWQEARPHSTAEDMERMFHQTVLPIAVCWLGMGASPLLPFVIFPVGYWKLHWHSAQTTLRDRLLDVLQANRTSL